MGRWAPDPAHVAVDLTLFTVADDGLRVLLHRRPYAPEEGRWALPGSFTRPGETLDDTARRALADKAGFTDVWLEQLATYDQSPGTAQRPRTVSVVHLALVDADAGRPTGEARWWPVGARPEPLAFGHGRFVDAGVARLRAKTRYAPVAFQLLPDDFTLAELQAVHEAVLDEQLDVRNFRRDVLASGAVEETGGTRSSGRGRPAKLYRHTSAPFVLEAAERRVASRIADERGSAG